MHGPFLFVMNTGPARLHQTLGLLSPESCI